MCEQEKKKEKRQKEKGEKDKEQEKIVKLAEEVVASDTASVSEGAQERLIRLFVPVASPTSILCRILDALHASARWICT